MKTNHLSVCADRRKTVWGLGLWRMLAAVLVSLVAANAAQAQARVTAAWNPNQDSNTAGYQLLIGTAPGSYVATIDTGTGTSTPLDLPLGAVYYFIVRAYNSAGEFGPPSHEATINLADVPGPPGGLVASVTGSRATLRWDPPATGGSAFRYLLWVGTTPGGADLLNGQDIGSTPTVSGDLPQGIYYARVGGLNPVGPGHPGPEISFEVSGAFRPNSPTGLAASWAGTVATLTWNAPPVSSPGEAPSSYRLEAGGATGLSDFAVITIGNITSYSIDVPLGTYFVRLRAVNASGVSDPSNEITLQGRGGPGQPTRLTSSGTGSSVVLRWNAATTGAPTSYVLEAGTGPGLADLLSVNVGNVTTVSTTAPPGVYYVRVRAVNGRGAGAPSNEIIVRR